MKMNIFQRIFKAKPVPQRIDRAEMINGQVVQFSAWGGDAYSSDIYRGAVDAIARNAAKLKGGHAIKANTDNRLDCLLQVQPNPYMNAYDLIYKLVTHLFLFNNAFAYLQRNDAGNLTGIYPIMGTNVEFLSDPSGVLYCRFLFRSGESAILPYSDIVHLRRHFNRNDMFGDANDAITAGLELAHTQNQGIVTGIKSGANIRGILSFTQIMSPEKLKLEKEKFMEDYLGMSNDGGVIATDQKMEYKPIDHEPTVIDDKQLAATRTMIYNYLGVSEKIVNSSYGEDEWAAFYESVIQPIAIQLSLEFTRKVFTDREQAFGNSILFESGRLQFTSNKTKVELIKQLVPLGLLTINQSLEILNLPGVTDGEKRIISLNFVNAAKADDYQLGGEQ